MIIFSFVIVAVRKGNLAQFNQVLENHGEKFQGEDTYILIIRLRHNVIKTGLYILITLALAYNKFGYNELPPTVQIPLHQNRWQQC